MIKLFFDDIIRLHKTDPVLVSELILAVRMCVRSRYSREL